MQRSEAILKATHILYNSGQDSCKLSAELILAYVLGCTRLDLLMYDKVEIAGKDLEAYQKLIESRSQGEPLAYILGEREFYGLPFKVTQDTLIPRPETELLVDLVLALFPDDLPLFFADLGTGSGNIGLSLVNFRQNWRGFLLDKSLAALKVAQENAINLNLAWKVSLILATFLDPPMKSASLDFIVANPPYIALAEKDSVMPDVLSYEPKRALFSPNQGLYHLTACVKASQRLLHPGGYLLVEHGASQGYQVREIFKRHNFSHIKTESDLAGRDRVTWGAKS